MPLIKVFFNRPDFEKSLLVVLILLQHHNLFILTTSDLVSYYKRL